MEETLFDRIKKLAAISGKSINKIERDLNYPRNALNNYKKSRSPSAIRIFELANYFGVTPEYLLGEIKLNSIISVTETFERLTSTQKQEMYLLCHNWLIHKIEKKI